MSKPIAITKEFADICLNEFKAVLESTKMSDGKISFTKSFSEDIGKKAVLYYTPEAWTKQLLLIENFESEVAWHGVCERFDDPNGNNGYLIKDILVYPQDVSGATVEMNTDEYAKWIMDNGDDERFYNIRMQAHSHVRMKTIPSGVDLNHQEMILDQVGKDDYYIFMIYNKSLEHDIRIYDMRDNIYFSDKDITTKIVGASSDFESFISDAKKVVKEKTYKYNQTYYNTGSGYYSGLYSSSDKKKEEADKKYSYTKSKTKGETTAAWNYPKNYSLDDPDYYSGDPFSK